MRSLLAISLLCCGMTGCAVSGRGKGTAHLAYPADSISRAYLVKETRCHQKPGAPRRLVCDHVELEWDGRMAVEHTKNGAQLEIHGEEQKQ